MSSAKGKPGQAPEKSPAVPAPEGATRSGRPVSRLPSVDAVLRTEPAQGAIAVHGHQLVADGVRAVLADLRAHSPAKPPLPAEVASEALMRIAAATRPSLRPVLNLTGTVLHTNLGRALVAEAAREAVLADMSGAVNLEYDVEGGKRGDRDDHIRDLLKRLTGAEDAIVVNNNAAAVILSLNSLALGREVIVSRGELVEIGGAFRMPDIMARAGCKLVEVGTTNRTHARDYRDAICSETAMLMKVHTSNFLVQGFTKEVAHREVAEIAHAASLPFVDDLGSGVLVDLAAHGLTRERTVQDALKDGADLVTFSGDKLLGGPQTGLIVGRRDLVQKLAKNPLKRALRVDKLRLAVLEATLRLYLDPDRLAERLPTLRLLTRPPDAIRHVAELIRPRLAAALGDGFTVEISDCASETGSGALPLATIPSAGLAVRPAARGEKGRASGRAVEDLAAALRRLPVPVIGRIAEGALVLDLRCLERPSQLLEQLDVLPALLAGAARP